MSAAWICILVVGLAPGMSALADEVTGEVAPVSQPVTLSAYHTDAQRVLREVLSQAEFRDLREQQSPLFKRFQDWIESFLQWLDDRIGPMPEWLGWAFWFWLIGGALAILGHFVYWLYQSFSPMMGGKVARKGSRETPQDEILGVRDQDYGRVYSEALRLIREADWSNAIRYLMVSAILRLDQEGRIIRRPFKTNGSYLQELVRFPEDQKAFRFFSHLAEPVLYGQLSADKDRCDKLMEALNGITRNGTEFNTKV